MQFVTICMAGLPAQIMIQLFVYKYCFSEDYVPPTIQYPSKRQDLYYHAGSPISLTCLAYGWPQPTFRWTLNGTDIVQSRFIHFDSVSGVLSFSQFSWKEEGAFRCIATNEFIDNSSEILELSSMSPIINLWQISVKQFDSSPKHVIVQEYDYVKLPCSQATAVRAKEKTYEWQDTRTRQKVSMDGDRLFIDQNGNLHFTYVLLADGAQDGYSCAIFVPPAQQISQGSKIVLIVDAVSPEVTQPVIQYHENVTARISSTAILECVFSGYDRLYPSFPTVKWVDSLNHPYITNTSKYSVLNSGRQLFVNGVQEKDETFYYCYANNSAGLAVSYVHLNVTSGPIFIKPPPRLTKAVLTKAHLFTCDTRSAEGETNPENPVWFLNSKRLQRQIADSRFTFANNYKTLILKNVRGPEDFVCVQCDVSNSVDIASANTCLVELISRWKFRSKEIQGGKAPPYVYFNTLTMAAYIDTCHLSKDEFFTIGGVYSIVLYTPYETVEVNTNVVLLDVEGK
ncbi:unnamed protein product, partial [Candidula unifasciata]